MAVKPWITKKPNGSFQVRYRDRAGKSRTQGTFKTKAETEAAVHLLGVLDPTEPTLDERARAQAVAERAIELDRPLTVEELAQYGITDPDAVKPGTARDPLAGYLREWIEKDRSLRETSRRGYLGNLRNWIEPTALGRSDIRAITPRSIEQFWNDLDAGDGTRHVV